MPDHAALLTLEGLPSEVLALCAYALNRLGHPAEALAAAERMLAACPNQVEALLAQAEALQELRRFDDALAATDRALELDPARLASWVRKAESHSWLGRYVEMLATADRAVQLDGADMMALAVRGIALSGLCRVAEARQVLKLALAACDRALAHRADDGDVWIYQGAVLAWLRKYANALEGTSMRSRSCLRCRACGLTRHGCRVSSAVRARQRRPRRERIC